MWVPWNAPFMQHVTLLFANADGLDEMALLSLQEPYSLSVLMCASPALHLNVKLTTELNVCWNMVFRRIFGYKRFKRLKRLKLPSPELRRLYNDLIWCYRILFGYVDVSSDEFFEPISPTLHTRGHPYKLFKIQQYPRQINAFQWTSF